MFDQALNMTNTSVDMTIAFVRSYFAFCFWYDATIVSMQPGYLRREEMSVDQ